MDCEVLTRRGKEAFKRLRGLACEVGRALWREAQEPQRAAGQGVAVGAPQAMPGRRASRELHQHSMPSMCSGQVQEWRGPRLVLQ